jgi:hypothetical protein
MKTLKSNFRSMRNLISLCGLFMGIMLCSSLAADAQAQNSTYISQKTLAKSYYPLQRYAKIVPELKRIISAHVQKEPISKVLQEITQKAGLGIAYNANLASLKKPITIDLHNVTVVKALEKVLAQTPFKPMLSR